MSKKNLLRNAALMCAAVMCLSVMLAGCKKKTAEVKLESIAVTTPPTKTEYLVNETFSAAGMVVTATYSDKSSKPVTVTTAMLSGFDSATPGAKTVTITYTEKGVTKTATVSVTVKAEEEEEPGTTPFVAVTNISEVPTTATIGTPLVLTGTVAPANATNKSITWNRVSSTPEGIGAISQIGDTYRFNCSAAGTVVVRATITNGASPTSNYVQTFTITVREFSGSGTSDSPYLISTAADLNRLRQQINAGSETYSAATVYYRLDDNITMTGNFTPIGTESPNRPFRGTFDGNGKVITGLTISATSIYSYNGLFGYVDGGKISNLGLANVSITGGSAYTGGVAGRIDGSGSISGCYVSGTVSGTTSIGGIVGVVFSSSVTINNCYTTCSVSGANLYVGGIAGGNQGTINNCYATGAISGSDYCGGIVGYNYSGAVNNCVALNLRVNRESGSSGTYFGRVVGSGSSGLNNNWAWSGMTTNSGVSLTGGDKNGEGIAAATAKLPNTYQDMLYWDFSSIWKWGTGGYNLPVLQWQTIMPSINLPPHLITL